ncbi:3495_t:CDS:2 [Funneliformis geosporum]|uniref:SUN-like protein 1 n=1 Tax=Funneliformis geosporum TaxID=1117311 RepID=A0A9W4SNQ4_9GLOM|nr:12987_t:CDS:2 [Funneliformis geosporum]CAI2178712.1 3495_t:CDS:2 [Funneliformis geosporum]
MSFGPFFAPTRTMEPASMINNIGESPAVPSLNKLIWTSSHCQNFLVGEMKSFNEPTIPSVVNTATNDQKIHNHSRKQQNLNRKKHRTENSNQPSHTSNSIASKSSDILSIGKKFNKNNNKNNKENRESSDQKRKKKRINKNAKDSQTMESIDEEGDIGAVFENTDSPRGLISEYDSSDLSKLKERFNYASIDCGANVLKANKEAKGTSAILSESKDSYVLNKCLVEKHFIVELCYPILVDTIVLANFEFFSSTFKNFRVSISKWYPPKEDWKVIGEYRAKNSRELQIFNVKDPIMFVKYLRIDFQTHYGHNHYCPISLLRVHGNSETDMWNKEQEQDGIAQSTSQEENLLNVESIDILEPSIESDDLDKLSEDTQTDSEHFKAENGTLQRKQSRSAINNKITKSHNRDVDALKSPLKNINVFEHGFCPRVDPLNRRYSFPIKIYQDNSLIIHPRICHIDQCPIVVTETDLLSDNYIDIIVPNSKSRKSGNAIKKPLPVQPKQIKPDYNNKNNLPTGGPNQSSYMFLFKRILTLELDATINKRHIEEQSKLLREVFGKVSSHSEKIASIMNHFTGTVESLKNQYEQLLKITFSEFHTNQIFVGVTYDWVNVRKSLLDLHAAMNARALSQKLTNIQHKHTNEVFYDVEDFYTDNENE